MPLDGATIGNLCVATYSNVAASFLTLHKCVAEITCLLSCLVLQAEEQVQGAGSSSSTGGSSAAEVYGCHTSSSQAQEGVPGRHCHMSDNRGGAWQCRVQVQNWLHHQ